MSLVSVRHIMPGDVLKNCFGCQLVLRIVPRSAWTVPISFDITFFQNAEIRTMTYHGDILAELL